MLSIWERLTANKWNLLLAFVSSSVVIAISGWVAWRLLSFTGQVGLNYPLGPDPDIWGIEGALMARYDSPISIPPGYPQAVSLFAGSNGGLVQGALTANAFFLGCVPIFAAIGVAALANNRWTAASGAVGAALVTAFGINGFPWAYYFQPEIMTLAVVTATVAAGCCFLRQQNWQTTLFLGACTGLCFSTREHGIVILLAMLIAILITVKRGKRLRLWFTFLLAVQIGGSLGTATPTKPFFWPYGPNGTLKKAEVAIRDSSRAIGFDDGAESSGGVQKAGAQNLESFRQQAVEKSRSYIPIFVVGALGTFAMVLVWGWRTIFIMGAVMSPLSAALVVFTQERHFLVLSGGALLLSVGSASALFGRYLPRVGSLIVLISCASYAYMHYYPQAKSANRELWIAMAEQQENEIFLALSEKLIEVVEPGGMLHKKIDMSGAGDQSSAPAKEEIVSILTGMRPIELKQEYVPLLPPHSYQSINELPSWPNYLYRTYVFHESSPGDLWVEVAQVDRYKIYRAKRPEGVSVDCLFGELPDMVVSKVPKAFDGQERQVERIQPNPSPNCR